jgi:hypothetical protein
MFVIDVNPVAEERCWYARRVRPLPLGVRRSIEALQAAVERLEGGKTFDPVDVAVGA